LRTAHPRARSHRSRRRPLTEFGSRSPLHAFGVWLIKSALIILIGLAAWIYVSNVAIPNYTNQMIERIESQ
jgi:hypothetical protein